MIGPGCVPDDNSDFSCGQSSCLPRISFDPDVETSVGTFSFYDDCPQINSDTNRPYSGEDNQQFRSGVVTIGFKLPARNVHAVHHRSHSRIVSVKNQTSTMLQSLRNKMVNSVLRRSESETLPPGARENPSTSMIRSWYQIEFNMFTYQFA